MSGGGIPAYVGTRPEVAAGLNMHDLLDHLDARERAAQQRAQSLIRRWALGVFTVMAVPVGVPLSHYLGQSPERSVSIPVLPETRIEAMEARIDAHTAETKRAVEKLAWAVLETQDLVGDSTRYLGLKIDRVHPRARKVRWVVSDTAERALDVNARVQKLFEVRGK